MLLISLILALLIGLIHESEGRSLSFSVSLSLILNDDKMRNYSTLSVETLRSCMKETETSMAERKLLRYGLLSDEPDTVDSPHDTSNNDDREVKNKDDDKRATTIENRNEDSLQCFTYCLYEKLGLIGDGVFMAPDFFRKFYGVIGTEMHTVRECSNLESNNKCEAAYKLHECYLKLKNLESPPRLRLILDNNSSTNHEENMSDLTNELSKELTDYDIVDPTENEIDNDDDN